MRYNAEKQSFLKYIGAVTAIVIAIAAVYTLILTFRPIVKYRLFLSPLYDVGETISFDYGRNLEIEVGVINRGGVEAPIFLKVILQNAIFIEKNPDYHYSDNDTVLRINTKLPAKQDDYWKFSCRIVPKEDVDTFKVDYQIIKLSSGDVFTDIMNILYKPESVNPIRLEFERIEENTFKRID